jgi:glycosyltransferase involved in cell wall biosynthesis
MSELTVSIIIPVYNGETFLELAIQSVLQQSYENVELVVVDDGSTDRSAAIAECYGTRLQLIKQKNLGQSAALAVGWQRSSGSLIGYLSADDILFEDAVSTLVSAFAAKREAILIYPDFDLIDKDGVHLGTVVAPEFSRFAQFGELRCLPGPGALFRRTAYEQSGPWRSDLRQIPDLEFFFRLAMRGDFLHLPKVLAAFRKHAHSASYRMVDFDRAEEPLKVFDIHFIQKPVSTALLAFRGPAKANSFLLSAIIHAQSGRLSVALKRLGIAVVAYPSAVFTRRGLAAILMVLRCLQFVVVKQSHDQKSSNRDAQ